MTDDAYLLFTLDDIHYGLAARVVQEIFSLPGLSSVPESGPEVAGVLNLRGHLLPVLKMMSLLDLPKLLTQGELVVNQSG